MEEWFTDITYILSNAHSVSLYFMDAVYGSLRAVQSVISDE